MPIQNHSSPRQILDAGPLAEQAADDDHDDRPEQQMDERALSLRVATAERRGNEQRAGHVGGRDPEDHRLQVPRAQQVAREHSRQVEAVEVARLGPIVRERAADQDLGEEEQAGDHHELERGGLRRRDLRRTNVAGRAAAVVVPPCQPR